MKKAFTFAKIEKVVLLARRSAGKRNKIARSFGGEGNRIASSSDRKGIGLIVDVRGREWNIYILCHESVQNIFLVFISTNLESFP